jgi:hypothetical protein
VARRLGVPTVAVYQTDIAGFADAYGLGFAALAAHGVPRCTVGGVVWTPTISAPSRATISCARSWLPAARCSSASSAGWHRRKKFCGWPRCRASRVSSDTVAELHESGHRARLIIAGDGPCRAALQRRAGALPITFLGFVHGRSEVAKLLATSDVSLTLGPHETFGLAALEALASAANPATNCAHPQPTQAPSGTPGRNQGSGRGEPSCGPRCTAASYGLSVTPPGRSAGTPSRQAECPGTRTSAIGQSDGVPG